MSPAKQTTYLIKLVHIGNTLGIQLPNTLVHKYDYGEFLVLEETEQGMLLHKKDDSKLSWEETYKAMAAEQEDWTDFESTLLEGLEGETQ